MRRFTKIRSSILNYIVSWFLPKECAESPNHGCFLKQLISCGLSILSLYEDH